MVYGGAEDPLTLQRIKVQWFYEEICIGIVSSEGDPQQLFSLPPGLPKLGGSGLKFTQQKLLQNSDWLPSYST
jgi:hypothetical protein